VDFVHRQSNTGKQLRVELGCGARFKHRTRRRLADARFPRKVDSRGSSGIGWAFFLGFLEIRVMRRWSTTPRPVLVALASLFAAATILYSFLWMYAVRHPGPPVQLGFDARYSAKDLSSTVQTI